MRKTLTLIGVLLSTWLIGTALNSPVAVAQGPTATPPPFTPLPEPAEDSLNEADLAAVDLMKLPILPDFAPYAGSLRAILAEGQRQGRDLGVFSRVGDCMTSSPSFLVPFTQPGYDLATYTDLQAVLERYSAVKLVNGLSSLGNIGLAAASGFNTAAVLDSTWSDPALCGAEEAPLTCEYRLSQPAVALILFGTNDLNSLTLAQFDYYLRRVVVETANGGIIPLLSTFPNQPGSVEKSVLYNKVVAKVAADYTLPLINLWRAFEPLPNQGIDPANPTHMTLPQGGNPASFAQADLSAGHNVHNLLTIQALQALWKVLE